MNRRNFIKLCGVGVSGVLFAQLLPGCASDTAETAQILISKSLTDSQREAIRNQLVECLDLTSNIGQYDKYPNLVRQKRAVLICDEYQFIEDAGYQARDNPDFIIAFKALAIIKCNFDFYNTQTSITGVTQPYPNPNIYKLQTTVSGQELTVIRCNGRIMKYSIKIVQTSPKLMLQKELSLPCIMKPESFMQFISNQEQISKYF